MGMRVHMLAIGLTFWSVPALAGDWFLHPFGELRSYHGDWLAVCAEAGRGPCRAVQIVLDGSGETRVGPSRLAVLRLDVGSYGIDVFNQSMPGTNIAPLVFDVDGAAQTIPQAAWRHGERDIENVAETVTITDLELAASLVEEMKAGRKLNVTYTGGATAFSLCGVTAALAAIEDQLREQNQ